MKTTRFVSLSLSCLLCQHMIDTCIKEHGTTSHPSSLSYLQNWRAPWYFLMSWPYRPCRDYLSRGKPTPKDSDKLTWEHTFHRKTNWDCTLQTTIPMALTTPWLGPNYYPTIILYAPEFAEIIQTHQPCLAHFFSWQPHKSLSHTFPLLPLHPDWSQGFRMWPYVALHAPFPWELWVTNYFFNANHLLNCGLCHTWVTLKWVWNLCWHINCPLPDWKLSAELEFVCISLSALFELGCKSLFCFVWLFCRHLICVCVYLHQFCLR